MKKFEIISKFIAVNYNNEGPKIATENMKMEKYMINVTRIP